MPALRQVRILIVDDDAAILRVLEEWFALFDCQPDTTTDGIEALRRAKTHPYDVVITDLRMPVLDGHQLLSAVKALQPKAEVIFLTGQGTMEDAILALREGRAFDFLQKPMRDFQRLNAVIERALERHRSPQFTLPNHVEPLTAREREILGCLANGLDNSEIADKLCLAEKTVKNHLTRLYEKLQVSNRTQAALAVQAFGLLPPAS
ncbi:MAG TPA: response regulator transcription factor [Oscillatoriaceae cyanobacterium]